MNGRKNILWIVLDHVTFRHYKMTQGARPILNTYNRLASEGVEFTNCHSVHPLCLPARACMMTGMYTSNHKKFKNGTYPDPEYPLISQYLCKSGYKAGYFGKNHSGYEDLRKYGFEGFFPNGYGNPYLTPEYREYLENNNLSSPVYYQEWGIGKHESNREYDLTVENNFNTYTAGHIKTEGAVHESDFLVCKASEWIDKQVNDSKPFFLRVDIWGPHQAFQVPLAYTDLINAEDIEEYPSFKDDMAHMPQFSREFLSGIKSTNPLRTWKDWQPVMKRAYEHYSYIDAATGKLLDHLEQKGISDDTIIIYTADHGDALGSHGGMVDKSGDMQEELMHIPLVIKWPGKTAGEVSDKLVSNLDIMPTVLEIAGVEANEKPDGESLVPLINRNDRGWREDFMAQHYGHFSNNVVQRTLYYKNFKYIAADKQTHQLYDLARDPFEMNNLIGDASKASILKEMKQRLLRQMEEHNDSSDLTDALKKQIKTYGE